MHEDLATATVELLDTSLARHADKWKTGLLAMRETVAALERSGETEAWKRHWDVQLYKALEHQYARGLETLNESLPEMKVELTFAQKRMQFRPPMEEIRAAYFKELRRFIEIPDRFAGVGGGARAALFRGIIDRTGAGMVSVYTRAADLFRRLEAAAAVFEPWVRLGQVSARRRAAPLTRTAPQADVHGYIDAHLTEADHWDANFRAVKA